ncbi:MAG: UDP-N-acetylmuramate dehydrogenase [Candidatus Omnitrophica bacterium]|jgi:UDP-N-acetylmuramate dehydrogenase|nr:UDP-N-acetylmuramate dehydrogenase [Candidatus Omnitrophota bacterium]MDD5690098.1 UDP-N-acetylmuramate dehydrogenase [Candidatus Omnitrophota bacterium]
MRWPKNLNKKIKSRVKLAPLTSFKVGGKARFFFEAGDIEELQEALILAKRAGMPVFILGAGSNILVSDSGLNGLVIKLGGEFFKHIYRDRECLEAGAALQLSQLTLYARDNALTGLEFLTGLPGTLGGALAGNAGAWGKSIGSQVEEVRVLDYNGNPGLLGIKELKFSYRKSNLNKYIIVSARIKLDKGNKNAIGLKMKGYLLQRNKAQRNNLPNAGCIFRNPDNDAAGRLIDACGLKGSLKGGAVISRVHANFILNKYKASSKDILFLMDLMQKKVRKEFKINLEPEIKIWR